jgi:putative NIF3 family GTP cyclohydrolase 1 type 2
MDKYEPVIRRIAQQTGTPFRPASDAAINQLRDLKFPESIVAFYARHEPADCAEGVVRIWPISHLVMENTQAVPGIGVAPCGYRVFASTLCGDAYCFNLNRSSEEGEREVVLIPHEVIGEDSSADEVHRVAKRIARDLLEFLGQFEKGEVDQECIY